MEHFGITLPSPTLDQDKPQQMGRSESLTNDFKQILTDTLGETNRLQGNAAQQVTNLISGQTENLHEVTTAMAEAKLSLEFVVQLRNKAIEIYKEIMRLPI